MRPRLVYADLYRLGASGMTINPKDKWLSPTGHQYSFSGYGGVSNCSICDNDTQVNEYDRRDGLVVFLCKKCEDGLKL
jgi:hypothetical protein